MKKIKIAVCTMLIAAAAAFAAEDCNQRPDCVQEGPCPGCTYLGVCGGANVFCQSGSQSGCIDAGPSTTYKGTSSHYICKNGVCGNVLQFPLSIITFHTSPKATDPNCNND